MFVDVKENLKEITADQLISKLVKIRFCNLERRGVQGGKARGRGGERGMCHFQSFRSMNLNVMIEVSAMKACRETEGQREIVQWTRKVRIGLERDS